MATGNLRLEFSELRSLGFVNEPGSDYWRRAGIMYDAAHGSWWKNGSQFSPKTVADLVF